MSPPTFKLKLHYLRVVIFQSWILSSVLKNQALTGAESICDEPPHVPCGRVEISKDSDRHVAIYTCSFPYALAGSDTLVCGNASQWETIDTSLQPPRCQIDCGSPPNELSARITNSGYNDTTKMPWATYECNPGYSPYFSVNSQTVTCDPSSLKWEQPSLDCKANINSMVDKIIADPKHTSLDLSVLLDDDATTCIKLDEDYLSKKPTFTFDFPTTIQLHDVKLFALSGPVDVDACGFDYRGTLSTTFEGDTCVDWRTKTVDGIQFGNLSLFPNDQTMPNNYCRRLQLTKVRYKSRESPWCFTRSESTDPTWGYCDIKNCGVISLIIERIFEEQNTTTWQRKGLRVLYNKGKLFERRSDEPVWKATNISVTFAVQGDQRSLSFCGIEIHGRSHQVVCSTLPSYGSRYHLNKVIEGQCNLTLGQCDVGALVEYECDPGWNWVKGIKSIRCESDGSWSSLTLECIDSPDVVRNITNEHCGSTTTNMPGIPNIAFPLSELHFVVMEIFVQDTPELQSLTSTGELQVNISAISDSATENCGSKPLSVGRSYHRLECSRHVFTTRLLLTLTPENVRGVSLCLLTVYGAKGHEELECLVDAASSYRGQLNYAVTGQMCDSWTMTNPNGTFSSGETFEEAQNYCRNIEGENDNFLWCNVNGVKTACGISKCAETCVLPWAPAGAQYKGLLDFEGETNISQTCMDWSTTAEGDCPFYQDLMFSGSGSDHNYCRNPDRRGSGPWCRVKVCSSNTGCGIRQFSCSVPTCPTTSSLQLWDINLSDSVEMSWFNNIFLSECWVYEGNGESVRYTRKENFTQAIENLSNRSNTARTVYCHGNGQWYRHRLYVGQNDDVTSLPTTQQMSSTIISSTDDISDLQVSSLQMDQLTPSTVIFSSANYIINSELTMTPSMETMASLTFNSTHNISHSAITSTPTIQVTSVGPLQNYVPPKLCECRCNHNLSSADQELQHREAVKAVEKALSLDPRVLSKSIRKITSARDDRKSAHAIGTVFSFIVICFLIALIIVTDVVNFANRQLKNG